jgi:hypothetical protein
VFCDSLRKGMSEPQNTTNGRPDAAEKNESLRREILGQCLYIEKILSDLSFRRIGTGSATARIGQHLDDVRQIVSAMRAT